MGLLGPNSLPPPDPTNNPIKIEQLIHMLVFVVDQMGGSIQMDAYDWQKTVNSDKTVQLLTQNDPWQLVIKVVDN